MVTLPHILPYLSNEELASCGVRAVKAKHKGTLDASGETVYKFKRLDVEPSYYSSMGKGYAVLQMHHFCFSCLEADESERSKLAADAKRYGYCLAFVRGPSVLHIYALYCLNTCISVSDVLIMQCT